MEIERECKKCNIVKPLSEFKPKKVKGKRYYTHVCKTCFNEARREKYKNNEEIRKKEIARVRNYEIRNEAKVKAKKKIYRENHKEQAKEYYETHKDYFKEYKKTERYKNQQLEYRKENKEQIATQNKKYKKENHDVILIKRRKWDKNYRENHKQERQEYLLKNRERINETRREYHKRRAKTDPLYTFELQIRGLIRSSFRRKRYKKNSHTYDIIGLNSKDFIAYLLKTFKDNYGYEWDGKEKVHIDHIIPLATANTEQEILYLCYYENLQLLKAKDNLKKGDKLNYEIKRED